MKTFLRWVLRIIGSVAILFGCMIAIAAYADPPPQDVATTVFILFLLAFLPIALGYHAIVFGESLRINQIDSRDFDRVMSKIGMVLLLLFLWAVAAALPVTGRVIMAILLLLIFARIHREWSSRHVLTPIGRISYGEVFDFTVGGLVYLVTLVIFGLLTGGRSGGVSIGGGGGTSGGGGASGRW